MKRTGLKLTIQEMKQLGVRPERGATFETNQLERFPALFEVVELTAYGAIVRIVRRTDLGPCD